MGLTPVPVGVEQALAGGQRVVADELGTIGGLLFRNFINGETINVLPLSYAELRRITEEDGQARGLLRMLTLPIANAKWDVLSKEEDAASLMRGAATTDVLGSISSPERDLIAENLFGTEAEGGMSIPFEEVIANMALAIRDGFKVFEKVFKLNDRGRVVLKKLARRENDTVLLLSDIHGDFTGFHQRTHASGQSIDVIIPKEKALLYTFGKEDAALYGSPLFLPVYYHMDKKHKLYYISHIAYQQLAVPPRVGTVPEGTDKATKDKFLADLASLGFNAAMVVPPGFEVNPYESKRSLADFIPLIDHHNMMATKAVLAQFMDLSRAATGRLAGEQQDIFIMGLVQILKSIEKLFNNWVIPQTTDFNFTSKNYPKLRARPFTDADQELLQDIFKQIMTTGSNHASQQFIVGLERKMAGQLEISGIDYATLQQNAVKTDKKPPQPAPIPFKPGVPGQGPKPNTDPTQGGSGTDSGDGIGREGNG